MFFKQYADEVSDARCAGDVDIAYKLTAEAMKLFENSAYGKTITNWCCCLSFSKITNAPILL